MYFIFIFIIISNIMSKYGKYILYLIQKKLIQNM